MLSLLNLSVGISILKISEIKSVELGDQVTFIVTHIQIIFHLMEIGSPVDW